MSGAGVLGVFVRVEIYVEYEGFGYYDYFN